MTYSAPHRLVDAHFGPWLVREPHGPDQEAMAPGYAARAAELAWQEREEPDPLKRPSPPPLRLDEVVYEHGHTRQVLPYAAVAEQYGPVRPVVAPSDVDQERLTELIRGAGRKALGTLIAALYAVEQLLQAEEPPPMPTSGPVPASSLIRRDPLTAGRPGSWEARELIDIVWGVGPAVGRAQLDEELHREATEIFQRWATGPAGYVEFAETIPSILAPIVDSCGGVDAIAEDWLLDLERAAGWAGSKSMQHHGR
jgi:hypothetical protein